MIDPVNERRPSSEDPRGPAKGFPLAWWLLVTGVIVLSLIFVPSLLSAPDPHLSIAYSQVIDEIEAGNVESVTIDGQRITGTFERRMRLVGDELILEGEQLPVELRGLDIQSGMTFDAVIPPRVEADLVALLSDEDVRITAEETSEGSLLWSTLLIIGLPLLFVVGLVLFQRRGGGGMPGQQLMNFGRARPQLGDSERPRVAFDDVAGEEEAKAQLAQVVDFLRNPGKYYRIGAQLPRGVLMIGPPGTGKTMMAKAVAGEAEVPFFSASASEFVEMFVGVGASRVRDLFTKAKEAAPAIVFIDEIDAVGRKRGSGVGGGNDEREQTLNQLLTEMDGFDARSTVIVIAATNRPDVLDPALLRPGRFDRRVTLGLPDKRGREAILRVHLQKIQITDTVDAAIIAAASPGFAGADLANLVNEAALVAAEQNKTLVEPDDFSHALDKIVLGAERPLLLTEHETRVLAYHEAGHAIAAHFTPGADPLRKISIVPRGQALGVTLQSPEQDRFNYSRTDLFGRMVVMLGGRAAERLVFNEMTTGAENDLKQATALARRMVGRWGMSEMVGLLFLDDDDGGEGMLFGRTIGDQTLDAADAAMRQLLDEAFQQATNLLAEQRIVLDQLAEALIAEETIEGERIMQLLGERRDPVQVVEIRHTGPRSISGEGLVSAADDAGGAEQVG